MIPLCSDVLCLLRIPAALWADVQPLWCLLAQGDPKLLVPRESILWTLLGFRADPVSSVL